MDNMCVPGGQGGSAEPEGEPEPTAEPGAEPTAEPGAEPTAEPEGEPEGTLLISISILVADTFIRHH